MKHQPCYPTPRKKYRQKLTERTWQSDRINGFESLYLPWPLLTKEGGRVNRGSFYAMIHHGS